MFIFRCPVVTEFAVDFARAMHSAEQRTLRNRHRYRHRRGASAARSPSLEKLQDPQTAAPPLPTRANPLKPPSQAEILFVLPSISMRLTSDQRQSMALPKQSELAIFARDLQEEKNAVASSSASKKSKTAPATAASVGAASTTATPMPGAAREEAGTVDGGGLNVETPAAKVHLSFQTDLHGVIQLGLLDIPWLPLLIGSYINEQKHDLESE